MHAIATETNCFTVDNKYPIRQNYPEQKPLFKAEFQFRFPPPNKQFKHHSINIYIIYVHSL